MSSRQRLVEQALTILDEVGVEGFATRLVCDRAGVKAPTLYHHFGDSDGLVSAAVAFAFEQFLARKLAAAASHDAGENLLAGWDDYVAFAKEHPRLYAAMIARLLQGGDIPAARASRALLIQKLERLEAEKRLGMPVEAAADLVWSTAHSAALLHARSGHDPPSALVIRSLRESARAVIKT